LFGQQGFPFEPDFLATTKTDYHAELLPVDFAGAPDAARTTVDQWVATETDGKIPELFPPGSIDADARLVLANAIVFKGGWDIPFDPNHTTNTSFHVAGGGDVTAPLMYQDGPIAVAEIAGGRIGVLPFHGKDLAMVVLLPDDPDGLPQLEAQLTGDTIAQAVASASVYDDRIQIALPKFTLTENQDLSQLLPSLGITSAFLPDMADFSGIDGARDLAVQGGFHDATITVDERGAEGAAATGVKGGVTSAPVPFLVDHSFAFAIFDNVTGSILFLGRVQDPTQP
jgi:serpin B